MYRDTIYGITQYADDNLVSQQVQDFTPNLMKYLPTYYGNSKLMESVQGTMSKEVGKLNYSKKNLLEQFYVDTATWGLSCIWEKPLGIQTDLNKSYEERREIIKAKLRGAGTITKSMIKNVAEAFSGGEVEVLENFLDYNFIIQFISIKGIPKNMAGLIEIIETIKPAHLGYSFKYTYTWWNKLTELTWSQSKMKTWSDLKIYG